MLLLLQLLPLMRVQLLPQMVHSADGCQTPGLLSSLHYCHHHHQHQRQLQQHIHEWLQQPR
jgi:hypothetical protein